MLLRCKRSDKGRIGRVHRLAGAVRVIRFQIGLLRARLPVDVGAHVESIGNGKCWRFEGGPEGHVRMDKLGGGDRARHSSAVVIAVRSP